MVDCYLGLGRQREAATIATGACKQMANSPQALTLYASVLLKVSSFNSIIPFVVLAASNGGIWKTFSRVSIFVTRVADTDQHGSALFLEAGSGFELE
jgi:hypothetical protein